MIQRYRVEIHVNYYDNRIDQYIKWCDKCIDTSRQNWKWDWRDVGMHGGRHVFCFKEEADLLAFKLRFGL